MSVRKLEEAELNMTMKMKVVSLEGQTPKYIVDMPKTLVGPSKAQKEPVGPYNRVQLKFLITQNP